MDLKKTVLAAVKELIGHHSSPDKIRKLRQKHEEKVHFIPIGYRVLGGIIQALNISFGKFIEILLRNILVTENIHEVLPECGKRVTSGFSQESSILIDAYMTNRTQTALKINDTQAFEGLIAGIIAAENNPKALVLKKTQDVDLLFRHKNKKIIYAEVKYNDDHDTGKFDDIYRKFFKTIAVIVRAYGITSPAQIECYVYYFNPARRYQAVYLPDTHTLRGAAFFTKFLQTKFETLDGILRNISESKDIVQMFDTLNQTTTGIAK